jgi:hypothetical protein
MHQRLCSRGLISPEDPALLVEASSAADAVHQICRFYRVFHSALLAEDRIELLLTTPIPAGALQRLASDFADLPEDGAIHTGESVDDSGTLRPCLRMRFDKRRMGRLYQFIDHLNHLQLPSSPALEHPGERLAPSSRS